MNGYCEKLLFVNLTEHKIEERKLSKKTAQDFIGGYGIGAKVLFEQMKPGENALGAGNILGFVTGPLTGTGAVLSGRYCVVCKSPVTGGWNDSNSGGFFGPELKKAGYDAIFISGISKSPVYLYIKNGFCEIKDASHLWGMDIEKSEKVLKEELKDDKLRAALIGPSGEKLSLMAAIINDGHRAIGRGGCGAVMGSKKLKAVVVRGTGESPEVAYPDRLKSLNKDIMAVMKGGPNAEVVKGLSALGTSLFTTASALNGDSPVKNWNGVGTSEFGEEAANRFDGAFLDSKFRKKKYACFGCPIGCGAIYDVNDGKWPVGETARPEYESAAAFGVALLNSDIEVLMKCNHICNLFGVDTISAGMTISWATECFENGILSEKDTGGITLKWGNSEAVVETTQQLADQSTEFGKLLALGSAAAAKKIGKGFEFLNTVQGIELPMHDPRYCPGFSRTYALDPTPARHVKGGLGLVQMMTPGNAKYNFSNTGSEDLKMVAFQEVMNSSGLCMFNDLTGVQDMAGKLLAAVTGRNFTSEEQMKIGMRIFNMRHAYNMRENINPIKISMPPRSIGDPPMKKGPLKGIAIDYRQLISNFIKAIDWDENSAIPSRISLEKIGGLEDVIEFYYP